MWKTARCASCVQECRRACFFSAVLTANAAVMIFYRFNSLAMRFGAALTSHNGQGFFFSNFHLTGVPKLLSFVSPSICCSSHLHTEKRGKRRSTPLGCSSAVVEPHSGNQIRSKTMRKNGTVYCFRSPTVFVLSPQRRCLAEGSWTPAWRATSPRPATPWSTRLTRTATGSSRRRSRRSASSSTSTRTSRSRGWTASKTGAGPKPKPSGAANFNQKMWQKKTILTYSICENPELVY